MSTSSVENDGEARRARAFTRIPFDGVVEVGAELGPPFAAQAVDVSDGGMHLRTAYLPEVGQMLSCRFEADREQVIATGEVVWQRDAGRGGEFGLRFVDLDPESAAALERMTDRARLRVPGARVRLHIDGLGAPMRARVKDASPRELKVGSELGFLQVGKQLDLEDAESGQRRPASIDRVEVEIDASSRVPQLVVALKYEDVEDDMKAAADEGGMHAHETMNVDPHAETMHAAHEAHDAHEAHAGHEPHEAHDAGGHPEYENDPEPMHHDVDMHASDPMHASAEQTERAAIDEDAEESMRMKGPVARAASKVTPALERFAKRTKTTAMILIEKARQRRITESSPIRRTTAPPPGGSLHTSGRKVVRSEPIITNAAPPESRLAGLMANKKKLTMMGAGGVAILAVGVALIAKKPATPPPSTDTAAIAAPADGTNATTAGATAPGAQPNGAAPIGATPNGATPGAAAPITPAPGPATVEIASGTSATSTDPIVADKNPVGDSAPKAAKKTAIKVTPFTNGSVSRGNLLRLKMDGAIEKIEGAQQPTGFTVHIPGHRSLEPAAPLAARDARIGSIKVVNDPGGAELSVTFKDGVPNYAVRAKGDQLEIVLASPGAPSASDGLAANKPPSGHKKEGKVAKHGKHKHPKH